MFIGIQLIKEYKCIVNCLIVLSYGNTWLCDQNDMWLRWWLHDTSLPGWNFNSSSRDRFHPTITWKNQISSRQSRTVFHLIFVQICIYFLLIFLCKHGLINFFIPLRRTEAIAWGNFVPAVQKRDPVLPGWNL